MKIDYSKYIDRIKFWQKVIENTKEFTGTSPPSIFIGRWRYPKVFVGILAPPEHREDAEIFDFPEKWYKQKARLKDIVNYRGQLIYSRFRVSTVKIPSTKLVETTKELAMAKRAIDVEIHLKKTPKFKFQFSHWVQPIGNPAPVDKAVITENPRVERKVEYLVGDYDLKAQDAVAELYKHGLPVSRIQKIFSVGLLGLPIQRKLVPTRWSITAVDDIIGKKLMEDVKKCKELGEILLFNNEYLGNHYEILLLPGNYQYELIESWSINSAYSDYEPYWGRKTYASATGGCFYAVRLAVLEYLKRIKRQATVLVIREVKPDYSVPVGIWQARETVRGAFDKRPQKFVSLENAIKVICTRLRMRDRWIKKSKLLKTLKEQKKINIYLQQRR